VFSLDDQHRCRTLEFSKKLASGKSTIYPFEIEEHLQFLQRLTEKGFLGVSDHELLTQESNSSLDGGGDEPTADKSKNVDVSNRNKRPKDLRNPLATLSESFSNMSLIDPKQPKERPARHVGRYKMKILAHIPSESGDSRIPK